MGRKKTSGNRSAGGRKKKASTVADRKAWDYGNERAKCRLEAFTHPKLHGGKAGAEAHDGIGMLYAMLWLEDHGHDSREMVRIAREYGHLFYERFGTGGGASMEPSCLPKGSGRAPEQSQPEGRSARYCKLDDALTDVEGRQAVRDLVLTYYQTDEIAPWVERLCNERRRELGVPVMGWLAISDDFAELNALVRGLCQLVDGALPARFARRAA